MITLIFIKSTAHHNLPLFAIRCLLGTAHWMMEATLMLCIDSVDGVLNPLGQQADWLCVWDCAPCTSYEIMEVAGAPTDSEAF